MSMKKLYVSISLILSVLSLAAQNTTNIELNSLSGNNVYCNSGKDSVLLSITGSNIPKGSNVVLYSSTNLDFNPYIGEGDSIGFFKGDSIESTLLPPLPCVDIIGIFIDACNPKPIPEYHNEYIFLNSGQGLLVDSLKIAWPNNSGTGNGSVNIGSSICGIKKPSNALMNTLRTGACNTTNFVAVGPGDNIPANVIVLFFASDGVDYPYNFSNLCSGGVPIYVTQNSCTRSAGAFVNDPNCTTSRYRTTTVYYKKCVSQLTYDRCGLKDKDGTYAVKVGSDTASVANGGIKNNAENFCDGISIDSIKLNKYVFALPLTEKYCNTGTNYIKAIIKPLGNITYNPISNTIPFQLICNNLRVITENSTICSGGEVDIKISSSDQNAKLSWTVTADQGVTGATAGEGNTISQVLTNENKGTGSVTYTIVSNDAGCTSTQDVTIKVTNPSVEIQGATVICDQQSTTLNVPGKYDSIRWSDGSIGTNLIVSVPGSYSVTAYLNGCSSTATVRVTACQQEICTPEIKGNTPFCSGDSIVLDAGEGFSSYTWNTGEHTRTITINKPGNYVVHVMGENCIGADSVFALVIALPQVAISGDDIICPQSKITLVAQTNSDSLRWNTGETTQEISVNTPQKYSVTVYSGGCSSVADFTVYEGTNPQPFSLGADTSYCGNFSRILSSGNPLTQWNTGTKGTQILVTEPGQYIATIGNNCGTFSDTIEISRNEIPVFSLGNDTAFCEGTIQLNAPREEGLYYLWNNGNQSRSINVTESGIYWVKVTTAANCSFIDSIVLTSDCHKDLWVPNAFSPNGDGINDVFMVRGNELNTTIEHLIIYNRWGLKVFEANNIKPNDLSTGWNGIYKGEYAPVEVYGYEIVARFDDGSKKILKGNITLLK